jgi:hypothetical protein
MRDSRVDTRGDQIVFLTGPRSRKERNLRRDPRMPLCIAPADDPLLSSVGESSNGSRATRPGRPSTGSRRSTPARPIPEERTASLP